MEYFDITDKKFSTDVLNTITHESARAFEDKHNVRIVISDNTYVYVTDINSYNERMALRDTCIKDMYPEVLKIKQTRIHRNVTRDGIFYTFGNIYGTLSIIMGSRFSDFLATKHFERMSGVGLKDVIMIMNNNKYVIHKWGTR
jgi:hypothetical protein